MRSFFLRATGNRGGSQSGTFAALQRNWVTSKEKRLDEPGSAGEPPGVNVTASLPLVSTLPEGRYCYSVSKL